MDVIFHGAAREVGRSCVELIAKAKPGRSRYLLDAGIKLTEHGTEPPSPVNKPENVKGVFISHAHLDHTGFLPMLDSLGMRCPIYCTRPTKETTRMLLEDAYKIGRLKHEKLAYDKKNISWSLSRIKTVKQDKEKAAKDINYEFIPAGHIPGSSSVLVESKKEKKKVLYTGDINTTDTRLLKRSEIESSIESKHQGQLDMLITEATYGNREHPSRKKEEDNFVNAIKSTIDNKGSVIIPVFAEGRAQEIMLLLAEKLKNSKVPLYIDGMGIKATALMLQSPESLKDSGKLARAFNKFQPVKGRIQREKIMKEQGIFVTTSGMLTGGPVIDYMKELCHDRNNSILLTGYQAEHTNGRMLLEDGIVFIDGWRTKVKSYVRKYDFSAHSGQSELRLMIKKLNPGRIAVNHGDEEACIALAEWADGTGFRVDVPYMNERIKIE